MFLGSSRFRGRPQSGHNREMPDVKLTAINSNASMGGASQREDWRSLYRKNLIVDPDTGMEVRLVRYPAGAVNPLHTHHARTACTLGGNLVTHGVNTTGISSGSRRSLMEHGATAEQDVTSCSLQQRFEIHYSSVPARPAVATWNLTNRRLRPESSEVIRDCQR